jgi:hypothetical protein
MLRAAALAFFTISSTVASICARSIVFSPFVWLALTVSP